MARSEDQSVMIIYQQSVARDTTVAPVAPVSLYILQIRAYDHSETLPLPLGEGRVG